MARGAGGGVSRNKEGVGLVGELYRSKKRQNKRAVTAMSSQAGTRRETETEADWLLLDAQCVWAL